ncbi:hypothetical protein APR04_003924 [Promicromonospora umidemergens]|nr:hypothetical protein [Promicromonospora umidemergens]
MPQAQGLPLKFLRVVRRAAADQIDHRIEPLRPHFQGPKPDTGAGIDDGTLTRFGERKP